MLNIAVLVPVTLGMITNPEFASNTFGAQTPARGILLSVYLAILATSFCLLFLPDPKVVATVLLLQILYKITTPFTVGLVAHPVVLSNLAISCFHALTVSVILVHLAK